MNLFDEKNELDNTFSDLEINPGNSIIGPWNNEKENGKLFKKIKENNNNNLILKKITNFSKNYENGNNDNKNRTNNVCPINKRIKINNNSGILQEKSLFLHKKTDIDKKNKRNSTKSFENKSKTLKTEISINLEKKKKNLSEKKPNNIRQLKILEANLYYFHGEMNNKNFKTIKLSNPKLFHLENFKRIQNLRAKKNSNNNINPIKINNSILNESNRPKGHFKNLSESITNKEKNKFINFPFIMEKNLENLEKNLKKQQNIIGKVNNYSYLKSEIARKIKRNKDDNYFFEFILKKNI